MPRGDGKKSFEPRTHVKRTDTAQYVPKGLRHRLDVKIHGTSDPEWPSSKGKHERRRDGNGNIKMMFHRPGSQNPRKS